MITKRLLLIAFCALPQFGAVRAELTTGLLAYYDFEATGNEGIVNQADGGATHNGTYGSGTTYDVVPAIAGSGSGFSGDPTYAGAEPEAVTDRSKLLVGNALNVAKSDASATAGSGWFHVPSLDSATLGSSFTISAWFHLSPDDDNTGTSTSTLRDYVFESADIDNFDVSFGTSDSNGNSYVFWLGSTSGPHNAGSLETGTWHHVVHVFSQSGMNTTLSVYINGVKVGATVSTATANMNFTSLNFGAARTGMRVFDGMLDEVAVWGRSITPNEVTELYQRGMASLSLTADLAAAGKGFVSVEASDPSMGEVFGTGLYDLGDEVFIGALPEFGHVLTDWSAPYGDQPDIFYLTVEGSVNIMANFAQDMADDDGDGLTNYEELMIYFTDPGNPDTDGDGISDGDEVYQTQTDPLTSQLAAVNYILENLGGGTQPGDIVLTRDGTDNTLTLKLKAATSVNLTGWNDLTPSSPGVNVGNSNGDFLLLTPGTADLKRFFRMEGDQP